MSISAERPFSVGQVVWTPTEDAREHSLLARYTASIGRSGEDYHDLWQWSVSDLDGFWASIWDFFEVRADTPYERVLGSRAMPGAEWFPGARLNFAAHMIGRDDDLDAVAVLARSQSRDPFDLTFGDLRDRVARARAGLQRLGVGSGDRVVAYLPNIPETLVAFLAAASLGAVWATCPPEFGPRSVLDRLGQLEPKRATGRRRLPLGRGADRPARAGRRGASRPAVAARRRPRPVRRQRAPRTRSPWEELVAEAGPLEFDPVPFDHPLYVLFSSGTTGLPKAIVHGHGGILLEHLKNHGLSWDLRPGDRLMWFTTTAWMMWNALVSALLLRASIVMLDGNPGYPDLAQQWRMIEETRSTMFGLSPAFTMACRKEGLEPGRDFDLSTLKMICAAGSPLPADSYEWIYEQAGPEMMLNVGSGGTDVCTGIVQGYPLLPVYAGEMAGKCLGVDVAAFDADGNEVVGELGELVIRQPMPSMPVRFWNDEDGSRYRAAYFDFYPGVWRHGDWIMFTERGTSIITGRSDATLNRGGVRLGTSELYGVVEEFDEVLDALVIHLEATDELLLFVVLRDGVELDDELKTRISNAPALRALPPSQAGRHRRGAGDPAHDDRQEARAPGEEDPHRVRRSPRSPARTR